MESAYFLLIELRQVRNEQGRSHMLNGTRNLQRSNHILFPRHIGNNVCKKSRIFATASLRWMFRSQQALIIKFNDLLLANLITSTCSMCIESKTKTEPNRSIWCQFLCRMTNNAANLFVSNNPKHIGIKLINNKLFFSYFVSHDHKLVWGYLYALRSAVMDGVESGKKSWLNVCNSDRSNNDKCVNLIEM